MNGEAVTWPAPLCLRGIHKQYAGAAAAALAGIDLEVEPQHCTAVVGHSGSGKSTLLRIAAGLLPADAGAVEVGGQQPWRRRATEAARFRRRHLGVLFQGFHLLAELDVLANVALPLLLDRQPDARPRAQRQLDQLGAGHLAGRRPAQLSGGEAVRAALARALVAGPRLLLADEPTASLDADTAALVIATLRRAADGGAAVLVVTHDRALAAAADRVLQLHAGRWR